MSLIEQVAKLGFSTGFSLAGTQWEDDMVDVITFLVKDVRRDLIYNTTGKIPPREE